MLPVSHNCETQVTYTQGVGHIICETLARYNFSFRRGGVMPNTPAQGVFFRFYSAMYSTSKFQAESPNKNIKQMNHL